MIIVSSSQSSSNGHVHTDRCVRQTCVIHETSQEWKGAHRQRADSLQTSRPRAAAHHRGGPAASHSHTAAVRVRVRARGAPPRRTPRASRVSCLARLAPRTPRLARLAPRTRRASHATRFTRLAPRMPRAPAAAPPSRPCGARAAAPRLVAAPLLALLPRRHRVGAALLRRRRRRPPSRRCRGGDLAAPAAAPRS